MKAHNSKKDNSGNYLSLKWASADPFLIESEMIRRGGRIVGASGITYGHGLAYHYKQAMKALWPDFWWHRWSDLVVQSISETDDIGIMGPASSGKTYVVSAWSLCRFFIWPTGTSIIMSTTTREALQLRIWGSVKELFRKARKLRPWLPGRIIESRYMLTGTDQDGEGQDFRDGIIGVACRVGGQFVGISNYVGLKNTRVMLVADEASLMEKEFVDAMANLRKNPSFKGVLMGNPKDREDPLGIVCEPLGGWENYSMEEKTQTWKTRWGGIAVQLCGWDTPNGDHPAGQNPYRGLITPEDIQKDLTYYGKESLQFSMMNLGVMPKDGGVRRVITMGLCESNMALEEAIWSDVTKLVDYCGLDAAYSGIGGDRCAMIRIRIGPTVSMGEVVAFVEKVLVPIQSGKTSAQSEEQIADFVLRYVLLHSITPERFGLDSTGRGSLVSALSRKWSPNFHAVEFGGAPSKTRRVRIGSDITDADAYGKMVSSLWFASRMLIEAGQMRQLPKDVIEDGAFREWGVTKSGKQDVEPKEKTKLRMGRSPDWWDALAVAIEVARRNGFEIAAGQKGSPVKRGMPSWLAKLRDSHRKLSESHALSFQ